MIEAAQEDHRGAVEHVSVWYRTTLELDDADVAADVALLSPDEQERHARLLIAGDRRDYAAAHALLRESLSRVADVPPSAWRFRQSLNGKPSLATDASSPLLFSLSHTRGLVACGVTTRSDIGVDVEAIDRSVDAGVPERVLSEDEMDDLRRCGPDERSTRFIERWTLKEAFVKVIGQWPSLSAAAFDLPGTDAIVFRPSAGVDAARWQFAIYAPTDRHRLAVAIRRASVLPARVAVVSREGSEQLVPVRTSLF